MRKGLIFRDNKIYVEDSKKNIVRFCSLHFQGSAKNELVNMFDFFIFFFGKIIKL